MAEAEFLLFNFPHKTDWLVTELYLNVRLVWFFPVWVFIFLLVLTRVLGMVCVSWSFILCVSGHGIACLVPLAC